MGNKAAVFPLQLLGFDVDVVNSVHFSNHTGYSEGWEGDVLKGDQLRAILQGLERNGLLENVGHILTGYIGSESFLQAVLDVVKRVREKNPDARFVCDPVLGDKGAFYVPKELVQIYRDSVIPLANVVTPNQFEVEQLTGIAVKSLEDAKRACQQLHKMGPQLIFITSCEFNDSEMSILASQQLCDDNGATKSNELWHVKCPILPGHFTGTGDLCASLLLAHTADNADLKTAMERVINTMHAVIQRTNREASSTTDSVRARELRLIQSKRDIEHPPPLFTAVRL